MKSQNEIAKELKISKGYLSDILAGKKGCNQFVMNKLKEFYPDLKFYVFTKPRYKIVKDSD